MAVGLRRMLLLTIIPGLPLYLVFGWGGLALAGWLVAGMGPCLGRRWPVGAWLLTVWGLGGFALFAVSGRVEYYAEGLTQAAAMLVLFALLVVPAWLLSLAGWDGRY